MVLKSCLNIGIIASSIALLVVQENVFAKEKPKQVKPKQQRECPKEYMKRASAVFKKRNGKTIVEIGSLRNPLPHPINSGSCGACIQGHSTMWWAITGAEVYTVDVLESHTKITQEICKNFKNVHAITQDGIAFLQSFEKPIDLLFLDAWDVIDGTPYAEKHLEAYLAAKPHLHDNTLILIDDTDIKNKGKGRLVIPAALNDGYSIIFEGRQTLLTKIN